jgi:hypothetical protein
MSANTAIIAAALVLVLSGCEPEAVHATHPDAPSGYFAIPLFHPDDARGCFEVDSYVWLSSPHRAVLSGAFCTVDEDGRVLFSETGPPTMWSGPLGWRDCTSREQGELFELGYPYCPDVAP